MRDPVDIFEMLEELRASNLPTKIKIAVELTLLWVLNRKEKPTESLKEPDGKLC